MNASRASLLVGALLAAAVARPAAGDSCRAEDRDAEGKCPRQPPGPKRPVRPPPVRPAAPPPRSTGLEVRGPDILGVEVSLDGRPAGRAPLSLPTTAGRHHLEVKRDGFAPYVAWIEVKAGEQKLVQVMLQRLPAPAEPATGVLPSPPSTGVTPSPPSTGVAPSSPPPPPPPLPPPASATSCPEGMLRVLAGTFQMGSDGNWMAGSPRHAVTLSAYCIDRTEVTVKAYGACVAAGRCTAAATGRDCNGGDRPAHPINCVDWHQAVAYCQSRGQRLPTEAEWEYAARGDDGREYPWGNGWEDAEASVKKPRLNERGSGDGWAATAPVGSFLAGASPVGALDMAGNVSEWTADRWGMYEAAPATNPQGPPAGPSSSVSRMIRGGNWDESWPAHRTMQRSFGSLSLKSAGVGLRCAGGS